MSKNSRSGALRSAVLPVDADNGTSLSHSIQFQSSFESQLSTRGARHVEKRLSYVYPLYFYYYFRVGFILCLVPLWVEMKEQKSMTLRRYKLQNILCTVIHILCLVSSTLDFREATAHTLKDRPGKIFEMVNLSFLTMFLLVFAKVVRSQQLTKLFEQPLPTIARKVTLNLDLIQN